jgi:DNA-binding CsgD family transcriptional regulator
MPIVYRHIDANYIRMECIDHMGNRERFRMHKGKEPIREAGLVAFDRKEWTARLWKIPHDQEMMEPVRIASALRERIKELNCLYGIAQLAERFGDSMEELLAHLVEFLPLSWQFPEVTCARIVFDGRTYKSQGFKVSDWRQTSRIFVYKEPLGEVAVFYLEERPAADEGPFLSEERIMLDEVARRIGAIAIRLSAERELQDANKQLMLERGALQESNTALRAVLARIEEEKQRIYRDVQVNVERVVIPLLHALALELPKEKRKYLEILRNNLEEITSPFLRKLSGDYQVLTQTEIGICDMIRNGMRTKDIAQLRGVSASTINRHREHIRKKLKITNCEVNLETYLKSL